MEGACCRIMGRGSPFPPRPAFSFILFVSFFSSFTWIFMNISLHFGILLDFFYICDLCYILCGERPLLQIKGYSGPPNYGILCCYTPRRAGRGRSCEGQWNNNWTVKKVINNFALIIFILPDFFTFSISFNWNLSFYFRKRNYVNMLWICKSPWSTFDDTWCRLGWFWWCAVWIGHSSWFKCRKQFLKISSI